MGDLDDINNKAHKLLDDVRMGDNDAAQKLVADINKNLQ